MVKKPFNEQVHVKELGDGKYVVLNPQGDVCSDVFEDIEYLTDDLAKAYKYDNTTEKELYAILSKDGRILSDWYDSIEEFELDIIKVWVYGDEEKEALLNMQGKRITDFYNDIEHFDLGCNLAIATNYSDDGEKYVLIDKSGKEICPWSDSYDELNDNREYYFSLVHPQEKEVSVKVSTTECKQTNNTNTPNSMYNEQLEMLIDAALADGVLTEKEKQVLFKKAQSMGVDLDEFEMVLDARLVKLHKEENAKAAAAAPKSNKYGDVRKCPSCGAIVRSGDAVCPECGHAFSDVAANSSAQLLASKLEAMEAEYAAKHGNKSGLLSALDLTRIKLLEQEASVVANFPVPNTRGDLLEFLSSMKSRSQMSDHDTDALQKAYKAKYHECVLKARSNFANDPAFQQYVKLTVGEQISAKIKGWFGLQ